MICNKISSAASTDLRGFEALWAKYFLLMNRFSCLRMRSSMTVVSIRVLIC